MLLFHLLLFHLIFGFFCPFHVVLLPFSLLLLLYFAFTFGFAIDRSQATIKWTFAFHLAYWNFKSEVMIQTGYDEAAWDDYLRYITPDAVDTSKVIIISALMLGGNRPSFYLVL